jgi:hypothetical protein
MAPVPDFDARGFLPPFLGPDATTPERSPYEAGMVDLLGKMGTTGPRRVLLKGLLEYRELLGRLGYTEGLQFVDGSFVENIEIRKSRPPSDIDVFSFLVRPGQYRSDPALWASTGFSEWSKEVVDRTINKQRFGLDTYAVAADGLSPLQIINQTVYWYSLFSHKRVTHDWKGFLQIPLNASDDAAARAALVGTL